MLKYAIILHMEIIIALSGYIILAVVGILDKFILSDRQISPARFVFYSTAPLLLLFLAVPFGGTLAGWDYLVALLSGCGFGLGLYFMYRGFEKSEVSHIGPLVGGSIPVVTLILGSLFLNEQLTDKMLWGVMFLIIGSFVIAMEYTSRRFAFKLAMIWGVLAALAFAISHVTAKYLYTRYGFVDGFVWSRAMIGVFGFLFLLIPKAAKDIFSSVKTKPSDESRNSVLLVAADKILGVAGVVIIQFAISLGSVTVINALAGVQFAVLVLLVGVMTKCFPKRFKEEYSATEVVQEAIAIVLISIGLALVI